MGKIAIAIHGGAGTILKGSMSAEQEVLYRQGLNDALEAGHAVLKTGGTSLDAVELAVKILEDNVLFNAAKGAVFTHKGSYEMDACLMSGRNLKCGAVAGISKVKNPVSLARMVMDRTEHVLLSGNGALEFAQQMNLPFMDDDYFFSQLRYDQWQGALQSDSVILDHTVPKEKKFGTVGAVALDMEGDVAAATSTGGMTNKKYGRIGDTPLVGSGTYANNDTCAVSCTGHGEYFIRSVVAYDISCLMEYKGLSLKEACNTVVMDKLVRLGGEGGVIALDRSGNIELTFNSEGMYRASRIENEPPFIGIYK